jgi:hypothetical protein
MCSGRGGGETPREYVLHMRVVHGVTISDEDLHAPVAFADLPESSFPFTVEALHPKTNQVVWSTVVAKPEPGQKIALHIPPLRRQLGHSVKFRAVWPDGTITTMGPPQ